MSKVDGGPGMAPILEIGQLVEVVRDLKAGGKKVVFTNGVYDLLHPGHVRFLREARSLGNALVVALNTDDSVRRLKGEKRPLIPLNERAKIMASLEMVDFVTMFDEDTPQQIIERLVPDVLVKGGDYTPETTVGREVVEAAGGRVVNLPLTEGLSSTGIIDRIVTAAEAAKSAQQGAK